MTLTAVCRCDKPERIRDQRGWYCRLCLESVTPKPTTATIALGYLPESLNKTMYRHWTKQRQAKQGLQADLEIVLLACKDLPRPVPTDHLAVSVEFVLPDHRRRDLDNLASPLRKALGDALVNGRWLSDDTPDHLAYRGDTAEYAKGIRATRIRLEWQ